MLPPIFSVFALFLSSVLGIQTESDKMVKLFSQGKAEEISAYFSSSIQLTTPGKEGVYSKAQAKMILTDFFESHKPSQASLQSKGNSDNGAQFIILTLKTADGDYKVNIFYRGTGNSVKIHELKIEK
jgi:Domain of unknown function (DUF4783)